MTESPKSSMTPKRNGSWWRKNWFYTVLIVVALLGGLGAFWIPFWLPQPFSAGDSISTLRQAILAATGGVLAILTLWETRRKNIQEKERNEQDHTRQVHAERRSRYAKAIEQLADDKAAIRLGGVYTLVKLVDDWLEDEKTLPSEEERRQEGQIIIDSLCAYIRSPFDLPITSPKFEIYPKVYKISNNKGLYSHKISNQEYSKNQAQFYEEQEVRQTILSEIKKRLNGNNTKIEDDKYKIKPGPWSYFEYDFSNSFFFYPADFSNSYFGSSSKFAQVTFAGEADFSKTIFHNYVDFARTELYENARFSKATFAQKAKFGYSVFTKDTYFSKATFIKEADFFKAIFKTEVNFSWATFAKSVLFRYTTFNMFARFYKTTFMGDASFYEATFTGDTYFSGATFTKRALFSKANFHHKPLFKSSLYPWEGPYIARFSRKVNSTDDNGLVDSAAIQNNFSVAQDSPNKIETEEHRSPDGTTTIIPKGCIVFDPKTGKEIPGQNPYTDSR